MSYDSEAHNVKCPFYHRAESNKIYCEGVAAKSSVINLFQDRISCWTHRNTYCCSMCYKKCPLAIGLNIHYNSDS